MRKFLFKIKKAIILFVFKLKTWFYFKRNNIRVAKGTYVERGTKIGKYTRINNASYIAKCEIGSFCAIGGRLVVRSSNHRTNYINMQSWAQKEVIKSKVNVAGYKKKDVVIGNGVWIGDSVVVLPGASVGNGAVIGAGSIVTKKIPDFAIAVGNPAKVVKYRFSENIRDLLKDIPWWTWSQEKIQRNKEFFETDFSNIDYSSAVKIIDRLE